MQYVHESVSGVRALVRVYGDSVLVTALIVSALSVAISLAGMLTATP